MKIMDKRKFVVIIWHQAGGRNENQTYYTWNDIYECARVFNSANVAYREWKENEMGETHAGFVVEVTASSQDWI